MAIFVTILLLAMDSFVYFGEMFGEDYFVKFAGGYVNHLAVFNDYTRHEEMAILCVMTSPVSNKIRKWNSHFITT